MPFREKPGKTEPRSLGELIDGLSGAKGWAERVTLGKLRARWAEIAGPAIAARSEPIKLESGVLVIRAESGTWATELTLLGRQLAARVDRALGAGSVRDVRVISTPSERRNLS